MKKITIFLVLVLFGTMACNRYIAPPFTDVDKISRVKTGMKLKQVVDILEIPPYDVYHLQETGSSMYSFNYRLKDRLMSINTINQDERNRQITNEDSQTKGIIKYNKEYKTLYVLMKENTVVSMISTSGREDSEQLVIQENNIRFLDESDYSIYENLDSCGYEILKTQNTKSGGITIFNR